MDNGIDVKSNISSLADQLERDIRQRGLWTGDRYLTAAEAAEMLQVSSATADRAMKLLAQRQMLVRRRNLGTFVGPHFEMKRDIQLRTVYAVAPSLGLGDDTFPYEYLLRGIRARLGDVNVQASFLSAQDPLNDARKLVHAALKVGEAAGFVPVSCPHDVYRRLADSGVPTVIFGTPFIDQQDIASLDVDNRSAGRMLVEHLIGRGHRRIAMLTPAEGRPGDNCFYDGVSEALTEGGLPHNSLIARIVPSRPAAVFAQLEQFAQMSNPPTALVIRSPSMACNVAATMASGDGAASRIEIVYQNHPATSEGSMPFACVEPTLSFMEIAARIGDMLDRLGRGELLEEPHVVVPVALKTAGDGRMEDGVPGQWARPMRPL